MNAFRLAGDMTHLLSIILLLLKIRNMKSCAGLPPFFHHSPSPIVFLFWPEILQGYYYLDVIYPRKKGKSAKEIWVFI